MDLLAESLRQEGFMVQFEAQLETFAGQFQDVDLLAVQPAGRPLGWILNSDGSIVLHADLQRISLQPGLIERLQRVARRYSLLLAFDQVEQLGSSVAEFSVNPL